MQFTHRRQLAVSLCLALAAFLGLAAAPLLAQGQAVQAQQGPPGQTSQMLPQAHAHNDYLHSRPLLDALERGFGSVEADIFLVDGALQVAHTRKELEPERTLQSLYLDPLKARVAQHQGSVYGDGTTFTLLIDIKTDAESTYRALHDLLAQYSSLLTRAKGTQLQPGAVAVIVSGNRPIELIRQTTPRYVGIDGRLSDLDSDLSASLMPLISDNWRLHFSWRGQGEFSLAEQQKLKDIIAQTHARHRRLRFWGTPDSPAMWSVLRDAGVDFINTDDLQGLSKFLRTDQH